MEIFGLIILVLFLGIVAFLMIVLVVLKNDSINKNFAKHLDSQYDDDFSYDDNQDLDIDIPFVFENAKKKIEKKKVKKKKTENKSDLTLEMEVINILINKKNYVFLANNYHLTKNDRIKLLMNNKTYYGVVVKGNYIKKDIDTLKNKPQKLVVITEKSSKKQNGEMEYVPRKKNKDNK